MNHLYIISLTLLAIGGILLSALVITVSLSQRLHRRDPIFNNFLYIWILFSATEICQALGTIAGVNPDSLDNAREAALITMAKASTLNLCIHIWFTFRSGTHQSSPRSEKLRTLFLVVTPYILSAIVFPLLLFTNQTGLRIVGSFYLIMVVMNLGVNIILLIKYWRYNHRLRDSPLEGILSISFFFRLLAFASYHLVYNCFFFLNLFHSAGNPASIPKWKPMTHVVISSFPLLAFCVVGLHTDIMHLWFPCLPMRVPLKTIQMVEDSGRAVPPDTDEMRSLINPHEDGRLMSASV